MRAELENKLKEKFPEILRDIGGDPMKTCMAFGIECSDGWYNIIEECLIKLSALSKDKELGIIAEQIKEKYGSLRFYVSWETTKHDESAIKEMYKIIEEAENKSEKTCELCGKDGSISSNNFWLKCLCNEHKPIGGKSE